MGQNFSWLELVGHGLERQGPRRQRAGNLWDEVRRICVEDECTCFCEPIKGQSKTTKTYFCLLIHKNCTYLWKNFDWCRARDLFAYRLPSVTTTEYSSSSWWPTSRRRWSDWILEIKRLSSEWTWELSTLVWRKVEEQHGRRRRRKEKISVLLWFFRNHSVPPSSSRSFRTQSHWSFITGQCLDSERFLRVHLSHRMCSQCTLHHKFRIDTGRTKFEQRKTYGILFLCESYEQGTQRSVWDWLESTASCTVHA